MLTTLPIQPYSFRRLFVLPLLVIAIAACTTDENAAAGSGSTSSSTTTSSSSSSGATGGPDRSLVLVGGGLDPNNQAIFGRIVEKAGGVGKAKIGILTASAYPYDWDDPATRDDPSSSNSKQNALYYADLFTSFGAASAEWIPVDVANVAKNADPAIAADVESMTGFFFSGGDQSRIIASLIVYPNEQPADSIVLAAIRKRFEEGAVISGSSAGTAVLPSKAMIADGESYSSFVHPSTAKGGAAYYKNYTDQAFQADSTDALVFDPDGGLGFFTYGLLDTHFSERGRQGRLVRLGAISAADAAYAVDENTALVVTAAGAKTARMDVVGEGGVTIFDFAEASFGSSGAAIGVRASYLRDGDAFIPDTGDVIFGDGKAPSTGDLPAPSSVDIFSSPENTGDSGGRRNPRKFVDVSSDLFRSQASKTTAESCEDGPFVRVTLEKDASSKAVVNSNGAVSYTGLSVAMAPVDEEHDFGECGCSGRYGHTAAVHNGKMYVIGGIDRAALSDVWSSSDGKIWVKESPAAGFEARSEHSSVSFAGKLWVLGGGSAGAVLGDVWSSVDGSTWNQAAASPGWAARAGHSSLAFKGALWLYGGADALVEFQDTWFSADGSVWATAAKQAPFYRQDHSSVVFPCPIASGIPGDCLWVLGGYDSASLGKYLNDVWYTGNGADWYKATGNANWDPRSKHSSAVFSCPKSSGLLGNCIWVLGGYDDLGEFRSVWYSKDGASWSLAVAKPPWPRRADFASLVFACPPESGFSGDCLWVIGGKGGAYRYQDSWYSADGTTWKRSSFE